MAIAQASLTADGKRKEKRRKTLATDSEAKVLDQCQIDDMIVDEESTASGEEYVSEIDANTKKRYSYNPNASGNSEDDMPLRYRAARTGMRSVREEFYIVAATLSFKYVKCEISYLDVISSHSSLIAL